LKLPKAAAGIPADPLVLRTAAQIGCLVRIEDQVVALLGRQLALRPSVPEQQILAGPSSVLARTGVRRLPNRRMYL
jgi:hypothetical protein